MHAHRSGLKQEHRNSFDTKSPSFNYEIIKEKINKEEEEEELK